MLIRRTYITIKHENIDARTHETNDGSKIFELDSSLNQIILTTSSTLSVTPQWQHKKLTCALSRLCTATAYAFKPSEIFGGSNSWTTIGTAG